MVKLGVGVTTSLEARKGLKALESLLADTGLIHLFLYADAGRWEIHRTQRALSRLGAGCGAEGLRLGRRVGKTPRLITDQTDGVSVACIYQGW